MAKGAPSTCLGCEAGEAGGNWTIIEGIVQETLTAKGIAVTVYHLQGDDDFARQPALDFF